MLPLFHHALSSLSVCFCQVRAVCPVSWGMNRKRQTKQTWHHDPKGHQTAPLQLHPVLNNATHENETLQASWTAVDRLCVISQLFLIDKIKNTKVCHHVSEISITFLIKLFDFSSKTNYPTNAHWKYVPLAKFLRNDFALLCTLLTLSKWNVQWVALKASSVSSKTDERESGNGLLHWLLHL